MLIAAIIGAVAAIAGASARTDLIGELLRYWRRALRRHVDHPSRREAGEAKIDEFAIEAEAMIAGLRGWMQSFAEAHRRYSSTQADYDELAARLVDDFYPAQVRLIDLADELRRAIGDFAYLEITDDVEGQLRKARKRRLRREAKVKSTSR